jgi:NADH pyrophosphatase NudC (nudix superfamily)
MLCNKCGEKFYDNPVPVVMCLVEKIVDGRHLVLMSRNVTSPSNMPLVFLAGYLEKTDASPVFGMSRELKEGLSMFVFRVDFSCGCWVRLIEVMTHSLFRNWTGH